MNWSRETLNADFLHVKCCLPGIRKGFLHRIVTGDEMDPITQRRGNHGDHLAMLQHRQPSRIFMEKNSCCVFGGISLVLSCIMSCLNRTRPLLGLSIEHNWWDWAEHSRKNAHYYSRHDKIILLHDNVRSHVVAPVKTYLETLKWEVLSHPPYSPDILFLPTTTCFDR